MDFMLPVGRLYHVAYVVPDLRTSMDQLAEVLHLEWATPAHRSGATNDRRHGRIDVDFWITYSQTGPPHIELIEGVPGSLWEPEEGPRIHHIGMWAEDLHADSMRLANLGLPVVGHGVGPDGGLERFAYHDNRYGPLIELVAPTTRAPWELWMRGQELMLD